MTVRINGDLAPGQRVALYDDANASEPYFAGVVTRVNATVDTMLITVSRAPDVETEEMPLDPAALPGGAVRPSGWR